MQLAEEKRMLQLNEME